MAKKNWRKVTKDHLIWGTGRSQKELIRGQLHIPKKFTGGSNSNGWTANGNKRNLKRGGGFVRNVHRRSGRRKPSPSHNTWPLVALGERWKKEVGEVQDGNVGNSSKRLGEPPVMLTQKI